MRLIVADTSPLYYLLLIDQIDLLPRLFGTVFIPAAVHKEMCHPAAPPRVREWAAHPPAWVEIASVTLRDDDGLQALGAGERAAITLASSMRADLILIDERKGTQAALQRGFETTGTLGVLRLASRRGLINLAESFDLLKRTNFRSRQHIRDQLLDEASRDR